MAAHLLLAVWALIRLVKDKRPRVAGLPRGGWAAIIVLLQVVGPVVFLIMHTKERRSLTELQEYQQAQSEQDSNAASASSVIDDLYRK